MDSCENNREIILDLDTDAQRRQQIRQALQHLDECEYCAAALKDFDRMRAVMAQSAPGVPDGGWEAMAERLTARPPPIRSRSHFHLMRIAAVVLVAMTGFLIGGWFTNRTLRQHALTETIQVAADSSPFAYPMSDRTLQATAFDRMSEVYDHRAEWMMLGDHVSDVGISDTAIAPQQTLILMRLTLLQLGRIVSRADVAILPGQSARLSFGGQRDIQLEYHISTSSDHPIRLAIWTSVADATGQSYGALATTYDPPSPNIGLRPLVTTIGSFQLKVSLGSAQLPTSSSGS